ncbi:MAG: Holliday junction branch migration protein RuvA [Candidatus Portnoybacteria bacterium CG06_land_8_20_14_3_00_39_12]|uniref:Holliday junction branch migration complex subunit RuvA n=1 Tax=Candidatus Portnoybacteria bacterium CG06_land_8_20_14_3_00_39_12 TaxID=1974809 RepID=A0A2M7AWC1_9BACT|nr:MAG: Holliday junction branch migration protein RuvA [Candidatus Portnoybacteria bacterium CG06_land_8_20_14_3_00_39_12]
MISYLQGKILQKNDKAVILLAGSIGWQVFCNQHTLDKIKQNGELVKLYTFLSVQEYQMSLFGFLDHQELELFEKLIQVNGVGPRMALNVLDCANWSAVEQAIASSDEKFLCQAKGVGQKLAQKIIVELKPKMVVLASAKTKSQLTTGNSDINTAATEALMALGYKKAEAQGAVRQISGKFKNVDEVVREALRILGS